MTKIPLLSPNDSEAARRPFAVLFRPVRYPLSGIRHLAIQAAVLFVGLAVSGVQAHQSPQQVVEDLTACLQVNGPTVPLLLRRAGQYRVLDKIDLAIADLYHLLDLDPTHCGAKVELSRIHLAKGEFRQSLSCIEQAIKSIPEWDKCDHLYVVRADAYVAGRQFHRALDDYDRAICADPHQVEWYLKRSIVHERLELTARRIEGLLAGYRRTHSSVIYEEWIEALITGGRAALALTNIEMRLKVVRLKSSWLIRRARALKSLGRRYEAVLNLRDAIAEIDERLNPQHLNPGLLIDRAVASRLLGDEYGSREDLARAVRHGATTRQLTWAKRVRTSDGPN